MSNAKFASVGDGAETLLVPPVPLGLGIAGGRPNYATHSAHGYPPRCPPKWMPTQVEDPNLQSILLTSKSTSCKKRRPPQQRQRHQQAQYRPPHRLNTRRYTDVGQPDPAIHVQTDTVTSQGQVGDAQRYLFSPG